MTTRNVLAASALSLVSQALAAGVASAQAPGAVPTAEPVPVSSAPAPRPWSIGLTLNALSMANPEASQQPEELAGGGIALAYRFGPRWEVVASLVALRPRPVDGVEGDPTHLASIGARLHLNPQSAWNVYLAAGVGSSHTGKRHDERDPARAQGHAGVGLAHRIGNVALSAELVGMAIAKPREETAARMELPSGMDVPAQDQPDQAAMVSLGAAYLF